MGIWYICIDVEDFFILMKYNIWVIFEVENYLLKLLFYFCYLMGWILIFCGFSFLEVKFILFMLFKFE